MTTNSWIYNSLLKLGLMILLIHITESSRAQAPNPDILIFIGDDMNWMDSEPYGNPDVKTPHIARLAREGMSFDNMFTSTAMCSPSRQQFFTGLYPVKSGAYPNHSEVYDSIRSMAHHFKELGYRVGLIGKQHYGPEGSFPFVYFGGRHHDNGKGQDIDLAAIRSFIEADDQPYLLLIAQNQPHAPWNRGNISLYDPDKLTVPEYMVDSKETRELMVRYYTEITYADSLLGVCLDYVDTSGKADSTLVIFTSEQGSQFPFGKWTCYDLGLKTAFIAKWPGVIKPSTRNDALVNYVDVLPTLLEAVNSEPEDFQVVRGSENIGFDGWSFLDVLLRGYSHHRDYVYGVQTTRGIHQGSACYPIRSVRSGNFKYIWNLHSEDPFYNMITTNPNSIYYNWLEETKDDSARHNWVEKYKFRPEIELYDLENDPFEMNNIAGDPAYFEVKLKLREELLLWMKSQGDKGMQTEMEALERQSGNASWQPFGGTDCN